MSQIKIFYLTFCVLFYIITIVMVLTITRPLEPLDVVERHERENIFMREERDVCERERAKDREEMNKNE
jgi:hypothetical protein